jgi:endogenous inhibitor of DNA gyrase (YacG/DUF329 family)
MEGVVIELLGPDGAGPSPPPDQKLSLECSTCGYGVARSTPPERCPMCRGEATWIHRPWRPFSARSS